MTFFNGPREGVGSEERFYAGQRGLANKESLVFGR
jgi:hypothetical protein